MEDNFLVTECRTEDALLNNRTRLDLTQVSMPNKSLTEGFADYRLGKGEKHPVQLLHENHIRNDEDQLFFRSGIAYGLHAPYRMKIERELVCQNGKRLGCLPSSFLSLDILMGRDTTISYDEINKPNDCSPDFPRVFTPHDLM